ncbi:MAG: lipopolysaccharide transport periplasmic protein LptA [Pseudomonadales bacterium]
MLVAATLLGGAPAWALKDDASQPIHIEGDDAEIDQANETIVYTGSVEIVQGSLRVFGERMVVKVNGDQVERITTLGAPAQYQQELEDNQGVVKAHADSIIYHTAEERIYLNGSASLEQKGNKLSGESIRYDIVNGKVDASAGQKSGRVSMQLDPTAAGPRRKPADPDSQ